LRKWVKKIFGRDAENIASDTPVAGQSDYSSDTPISTKVQDRFNRAGFSSRIAETLARRADPSSIVIGLHGVWGDGKTSVLQMMAETLESDPNVIVITFNPWNFQTEELLLKGFFSTLAQALDTSLPNLKEKIGGLLTRYGALLSLASTSAGNAAKGLGETLSSVSLDTLRKRIDQILESNGKRVVVLIDDIDRLDRSETHAIFKIVKLSASFRYTSYVLAFDEEIVSAALGERYGQGGREAGREFLEKIIQVPLHLPPADSIGLRQLAFEGLEKALAQAEIQLDREMVDTFSRHFIAGLEHRLVTPRLAKLYSNAVMFALPLLKGEVNVVELMLIEGVRILYPKLYIAIRDNPQIFLSRDENAHRAPFNLEQPKSAVDSLMEASMPGSSAKERLRVKRGLLEQIFPRLQNTIYDHEWDRIWARKKRICTEDYFQRYFTYGIPDGDVSDLQVHSFVTSLSIIDEAAQADLLNSFSTKRSIPKLIAKIRDLEDDLSEDQAKTLCLVLAKNASIFPQERGPMVYATTRMQGGILIANLLRRIDAGPARQELAKVIVDVADPIEFGVECLRWICHNRERPEDKRVLTDEGDIIIKKAVALRIKAANAAAPIYLLHPLDAPTLYWMWQSQLGTADVEEALINRFAEHPSEIDLFLDRYVGEGWLVETGLPVRSDFERRNYDDIATLLPPEYIANNLRERYGRAVTQPAYYLDQDIPIATRIANQFLYIHELALQERNREPAPGA
jgi:predicted KAP-like P-loop ATPase